MDPSTIVGFLLKILPVDKLPKRLRTTLVIAACGVLTYWLAVYALRGADAMQWNVSHGVFLAIFAVVCLAGAELAWQIRGWGGGDSATAASVPTPPVVPIPAAPGRSISQSTTGPQSPAIIGDHNTVNYPPPTGPSLEEMKYRVQLADEISASRKSLDKSRNRWYTASVENRRPDADTSWKEAEVRMGESAALLRAKVSATAETEFLQIHPGEPVYPNLKRPYMTDGAAINEMWNRVARLTEIEKRVRNGTEPIKYPPPSP